jgi:hypothetical protein
MRKLSMVAALVALAIAVPMSIGSSHREAPLTSIDPTGDNTDTYAFTAEDAPDALTIAANWIPFEDPAGGPNFYKFDDNAHYYLNIDNTGEGAADVRYLFDFDTEVRNDASFLYGLGKPIDSADSANLNVVQTYTLTREELENGKVTDSEVVGKDLLTPPSNVGPKTVPDYDKVAAQAVHELPGGGQVFAGQRDDPFFAALGRIFDTVNLTGAGLGDEGGGVDDLAGYAVHSTVLQVPEEDVTADGNSVKDEKADNAVVGVWSTTERQSLDVQGSGSGEFQQISRLGNPLVNEVIIPTNRKDEWNADTPDEESKYASFYSQPILAAVLNSLFPGVLNVPEQNRDDLVAVLLTGVPGLNNTGSTQAEMLRLNMSIPATASPHRLGVFGGDNQGWPNGRRLTDDVIDIAEQAVVGKLKGNAVADVIGDGVDANDVANLGSFPYEADPPSGFDNTKGQQKP